MKVITAKDYIAAEDKLAHLDAWIQLIGDKCTREDVAAERMFRDHVDRLEKEYHSGLEKRAEQKNMMKAPLIEEKMAAETYILEAKKILKHLSLKDEIEKAELTEPHPEFYHEKIEAEGDFHRDEYTWIRYCIVKNEKPKNCYSLLIAGDSKLRKLFENHLHGYGLPAVKGGYPIWMGLRDMPTIQELLTWLEKHKIDLSGLEAYLGIRDRYIDTIRNYSLEDFKEIKIIREASEDEAPVVFIVEGRGKSSVFRIYNGFYYASVENKAEDKEELRYLKVSDELYLRGDRAEGYTIRQTGNLMFGDWWSFGFEAGGTGVPLNKENWEQELAEADAYVKEHWRNRSGSPSWNPPQITWVHPELIPKMQPFW